MQEKLGTFTCSWIASSSAVRAPAANTGYQQADTKGGYKWLYGPDPIHEPRISIFFRISRYEVEDRNTDIQGKNKDKIAVKRNCGAYVPDTL